MIKLIMSVLLTSVHDDRLQVGQFFSEGLDLGVLLLVLDNLPIGRIELKKFHKIVQNKEIRLLSDKLNAFTT